MRSGNNGEIAVTGMGVVTPFGLGAAELVNRWTAGDCAISDGAAACAYYQPEEHFSRREARSMDRFSQFAVLAADEAVSEAALADAGYPPHRMGCVFATGMGGLHTLEREIDAHRGRAQGEVSPLGITRFMGNAAAANIAIRYGWRGESCAVVSACASGTQAVGAAARMLTAGSLDAVLVGASEGSMSEYAFSAFHAMAAMSPTGACRPYDRRRDGFVLGEGAGALVMERASNATARGARVISQVLGSASTNDAHHLAAPPVGGEGLALALSEALRQADVKPEEVDYINPHGAGTPVGDRIETLAIKDVFGEAARAVLVSSTKSAIGHLQGAAGTVELVSAIGALSAGVIPPTLGLVEHDPELDLDYVPGQPRKLDPAPASGQRVGLSFSFGLGGHNAAVVVAVPS